jgi:plastocyanin
MRKLILLAALGTAVAAAGPAGASTWTVFAGPPTKAPATVPRNAAFDNFYPALLRVEVGDQVTFATANLHTVTFLGAHPRSEFLLVVTTPRKYKPLRDPVRKPFWWSGMTKFEYGTKWMVPAGGPTISDRSELHNAVISPGLKQPRVTYTFAHEGTYKYVCLLHPFMTGTIVVQPHGGFVPGPQTVLRSAGVRLGNDWANAAKRARSAPQRPNTVFMGVGTSRFSVNSFQPAALTVKVGTTVTFLNRSPAERHDVAFGPAGYLKRLVSMTDLLPRKPNDPRNQITPLFPFGTDPPPVYNYDRRNHGNGTLVPGLTDEKVGTCGGCSAGVALPGQTRITFTRPGTYRYVCLLHLPAMRGVVVVRR